MKTIAVLRYFGVPSLKVRRFAGTIKGEPVGRALSILELQNSPACQALHKLLKSAVANAEHNNGLAAENLVVSNVLVDNGPIMKRIRPRARGRAFRIFKRTSHLTVEVDLRKDLAAGQTRAKAAAPAAKAAAPKAAAPKAAAPKAAPKAAAPKAAAKPAAPKAAASKETKTGAAKSSKAKDKE